MYLERNIEKSNFHFFVFGMKVVLIYILNLPTEDAIWRRYSLFQYHPP